MAAVLKAGTLRKRGASTWQSKLSPRLFVLHANRLDYYLPLPELELLAAISLDDCELTPVASAGRGTYYATSCGRLRARFDGESGESMRAAIASASAAVRKSLLGNFTRSLSLLPLEVVVMAALGSIPSLETFCYLPHAGSSGSSGSPAEPGCVAWMICSIATRTLFVVGGPLVKLVQRGSIPLYGPGWMTGAELDGENELELKLTTGQREYRVQTGTPEEASSWLAAIRAAIRALGATMEASDIERTPPPDPAPLHAEERRGSHPFPIASCDSLFALDEPASPPHVLGVVETPATRAGADAAAAARADGSAERGAGGKGGAGDGTPGTRAAVGKALPGPAAASAERGAGGTREPADDSTAPRAQTGAAALAEAALASSGARASNGAAAPALSPSGTDGAAQAHSEASLSPLSHDSPSRAPPSAGASPGMAGAMMLVWSRLSSEREQHQLLAAFARWRHFAESSTLAEVEAVLQRYFELSGGSDLLISPASLFRSSYVPLGDDYDEMSYAPYAPFRPHGDAQTDGAQSDADELSSTPASSSSTPATAGAHAGAGREHAEDARRAGAAAEVAQHAAAALDAPPADVCMPPAGEGSCAAAGTPGTPLSQGRARSGSSGAQTPTRRVRAASRLQTIIDELERSVRAGAGSDAPSGTAGAGRPREEQLLLLLEQARALAGAVRPSRSFDATPASLDAAAVAEEAAARSEARAPPAAAPCAPAAAVTAPPERADGVAGRGGAPRALSVHVLSNATRRDARGRYTAYEVSVSDGEMAWVVWRRYSQFEALHAYLQDERGFAPALPPKTRLPLRSRVVALRQAELERYLAEVTANLRAYTPEQRKVLAGFLQAPVASLARAAGADPAIVVG